MYATLPTPADDEVLPDSGRPAEPLDVLLVEDDLVDRVALRRHLETQNLPYRLTEATSVSDARDWLAHGTFDVLVLDLGLPDGSGFDLFEAAGDTPVVFVTRTGDPGLAVRAVKAGAADYLVKDDARNYLKLLPLTLSRAVHERRLQEAVRAAQNQLGQVLEFLPAAAFAIDAAGTITFFNRQAVELWGRSPRPGESAAEFCASVRLYESGGAPVDPAACWRAVREGRPLLGKEMIVAPGPDRRRHVLAYANPLTTESGARGGAIAIWIDVTEMRLLEHRQRALESQLQQARRLEAVGTLAGGMAHDFNNLLTSILGNLQLAELDVPEGHPAQSPLEKSVASCRRARDLVSRMLTFSESAPAVGTTGQLFFPETEPSQAD